MPLKLQSASWRKTIPQNPGVYFFRKRGKILYIGKATNLRARLRSYFRDVGRPLGRPTSKWLLKEAKSLSWEILGSEAEALIREAELIKKYRPKYNVLMRDDKQYFYVGFTKAIYPKVFVTHQPRAGTYYLGPFTEGGALRNVLKTLRHVLPYCTCKQAHKRLCLNARIGKCLGFCCLENQSELTQSLRSFSPRQRGAPRVAWTFRSSLRSETVPKSPQNPLSDSSSPSAPPLLTCPQKLRFKRCRRAKERGAKRGGEVYQKNIRSIKQILSGKNRSLTQELKKEMHKLSDARKYEEAGKIRDQIRALEKIFEHRGVIKQDLLTESAKAIRALESLLKIDEINRIEAYDIANIHGKFAYGSMVVFAGGKLEKESYRLFKIKNITGSSNDPLMIFETISRRLKHQEWPYPEVIIVDGGKAQLNAAFQALKSNPPPLSPSLTLREGARGRDTLSPSKRTAYGVQRTAVVALTKNRKHVGDHIYIQNRREPISLAHLPQPLKNLILLLDSEAHRFAISHYRKLHRRSLTI